MPTTENTFRLFVSSTFSDFKAERTALHDRIFPRLEKLCLAHNVRFQAVDLRWGISEAESKDHLTIPICLQEIHRCQQISTGPHFIAMLGDRYGWQPLPAAIPVKEFCRITANIHKSAELKQVRRWYRRDDNAVPPVFLLQPRSAWYANKDKWSSVEQELQNILRQAAFRAGFNREELLKYTGSATEQEIFSGVFSQEKLSANSFCFFRTILVPQANKEMRPIRNSPFEQRFADYVDLGPEGRMDLQAGVRLDDLKERLVKVLGRNILHYTAQWAETSPATDHIDRFCDDAFDKLSRVLLEKMTAMQPVPSLIRGIQDHRAFAGSCSRFFTGRRAILQKIDKYLGDQSRSPLLITGPPGSGKSALMGAVVQRLGYRHSNAVVIMRFIGATPSSRIGRSLLESLCHEICLVYGQDTAEIPDGFAELILDFHKRLTLSSKKKPLFLVLDGLNHLEEDDDVRDLSWLPELLPKNAKILVTSLPEGPCSAFRGNLPKTHRLRLGALGLCEAQTLLSSWLEDVNRTLQPEQFQEVLGKYSACRLPLFLRLAFEEARHWPGYQKAKKLGNDVESAIRNFLKQLAGPKKHGKILVSFSLALLAASKNGLSEDEFLDLLSRDREVIQDLQRRFPDSPTTSRLPMIVWSRFFSELRPYLAERYADGRTTYMFFHQSFEDLVKRVNQKKPARLRHHRHLADYFKEQPLIFGSEPPFFPNQRKLSELPWQLANCLSWEELALQLRSFDFMNAKLQAFGPYELVADYDLYFSSPETAKRPEKGTLLSIQDALQRCAHILSNDNRQLASQLLARLPEGGDTLAGGGLEQMRKSRTGPWVRPLTPGLKSQSVLAVGVLQDPGDIGPVSGMAITPDWRYVVTFSEPDVVKKWNIKKGQKIRQIHTGKTNFSALAVTPDGRYAIVGYEHGILEAWDLVLGVRRFSRCRKKITALACSPDGKLLVSASEESGLTIWELPEGRRIKSLKGHLGPVHSLAICRKGRRLFSCDQRMMILWDLKKEKKLRELWLSPYLGIFLSMAVTSDGKMAVLSSSSGVLKVWDVAQWHDVCVDKLERSAIFKVALTDQGACIISGAFGDYGQADIANFYSELKPNQVYYRVIPDDEVGGRKILPVHKMSYLEGWDIFQEMLQPLYGHSNRVTAIAARPDSQEVISCSDDGTIRTWDLEKVRQPSEPAEEHTAWVNAVVTTPDGQYAISVSDDHSANIWDMRDGKLVQSLPHDNRLKLAIVTRDGQYLVTADNNSILSAWHLPSGKRKYTLKSPGYPLALAPGRDKKIVLASSRGLTLWDLSRPENRELWKYRSSARGIDFPGTLTVAQNNRLAISGHNDGRLIIWDLKKEKKYSWLSAHKERISALCITADGRKAAAGAYNGAVKVWTLSATGKMKLFLHFVHKHHIMALAVSSDGRWFTSVSYEKMEVWNLSERKKAYEHRGYLGDVKGLMISKDNQFGVSAAKDRKVRVWEIQSGKIVDVFHGDSPFACAALDADDRTIIAGDEAGKVHFLHLECRNSPTLS